MFSSNILFSFLLKRYLNANELISNTRVIPKCLVHQSVKRQYTTLDCQCIEHFNETQKDSILNVINNGSEEDLIRLSLGKVRSRGLCKTRDEQGKFENLDAALQKLDIKERALKRFCEAVLFDIDVGGASKFRLANIITPNRSPEIFKSLSSVVGLNIGSNVSLAWAEITHSYELKEWGHELPPENSGKKYTPCSLFLAVKSLCEKLPAADAFVLEAAPSLLPQQAYMQMYIQRREVQATLLALLNTKLPHKDRVFFLRARVPSRLYGIQVGSERVSSQPIVEKLLQGAGVGPEDSSILCVPNPELEASYRAQKGPQRESRANALLLSMAFLKLAVHEDFACLKSLHVI